MYLLTCLAKLRSHILEMLKLLEIQIWGVLRGGGVVEACPPFGAKASQPTIVAKMEAMNIDDISLTHVD